MTGASQILMKIIILEQYNKQINNAAKIINITIIESVCYTQRKLPVQGNFCAKS